MYYPSPCACSPWFSVSLPCRHFQIILVRNYLPPVWLCVRTENAIPYIIVCLASIPSQPSNPCPVCTHPSLSRSQYSTPSQYATERAGTKVGAVRREGQATAPPQIVEFMDIRELSTHKASSLPIDEPLFLATPSEVVFQNFVPLQEYEVAIVLRNADAVPRRVQVRPSESP